MVRVDGEARIVHPLDIRVFGKKSATLAHCDRARACAVPAFCAAQRQKQSNGPGTAPHRVLVELQNFVKLGDIDCRKPPIASEWPPMYLVVECTTTTAPKIERILQNGVANVLSTATWIPRLCIARRLRHSRRGAAAGWSVISSQTSSVDPAASRRDPRNIGRIHVGEAQTVAREHFVEEPKRAAVESSLTTTWSPADDKFIMADVAAMPLENTGRRTWRFPAMRDSAPEPPRRIMRPRIVEALMLARAPPACMSSFGKWARSSRPSSDRRPGLRGSLWSRTPWSRSLVGREVEMMSIFVSTPTGMPLRDNHDRPMAKRKPLYAFSTSSLSSSTGNGFAMTSLTGWCATSRDRR